MPAEQHVRLDIRPAGYDHFTYVIQSTGPVEDLLETKRTFPSRVAALRDFQRVCELLGWQNDIVDVPA